ncbi:MAG: hypothetical protein CL935_02570 [Deltaproteobacteria bacterium]|nr:hypothetical protein [Deltaproteobacteria bacterium]
MLIFRLYSSTFILALFFDYKGIEREAVILPAARPRIVLASTINLGHKLVPEFATTTILF